MKRNKEQINTSTPEAASESQVGQIMTRPKPGGAVSALVETRQAPCY